ncbi:MAG: sigma-70 family RNA polymerase sigma factor [Treponemataceae bacterium]|nr:sigma-70 family RNA polymerase sigma factor [Treponemataceae bacterium]
MENSIYSSYIKQILRYPLMSFEEEIEHSKLIHKGDNNAKMRLVQANLRLVVNIAKKYENPYVSIMDLIQEGNIGLLSAAGKYHYSYKTRFSTYAYAWISQAITRFLQTKVSAIMLPNRKEELLRKIRTEQSRLFQYLGHDPSYAEIAESLGISLKDVKESLACSYSVVSINSGDKDENGACLCDLIPDNHFTPEGAMMEEIDKQEVHEMVEKLPSMEKSVIFNRFNFAHDENVKTLRQLGDQLGVSAETVRQVEIRALRHLRTNYKNSEEYRHA